MRRDALKKLSFGVGDQARQRDGGQALQKYGGQATPEVGKPAFSANLNRQVFLKRNRLKMKGYIGVTDNIWFAFLSQQPGIDEVNFWQPKLEEVAQARAEELLHAHRRVRTAAGIKGLRYSVAPQLPPDVPGIYANLLVI